MKPEYKDRKYFIVAYDPNWKEEFDSESEKIKEIFRSDAVAIEHVGSTAVEGMAGKLTLDILLTVNDLSVADKYINQMASIGYKSRGAYIMPHSLLLAKEKDNVVYVNLHIFEKNHVHVREMLELRDYLSSHPEIVREYSNLKMKLYSQFPNDYAQYRKYKDEYMNDLKKKI